MSSDTPYVNSLLILRTKNNRNLSEHYEVVMANIIRINNAENEIPTPDHESERSLSDVDEPMHVETEPEENPQVPTEEVNEDPSEINEEQSDALPVTTPVTNTQNISTQNKEVLTTPSLVKRSNTAVSPGADDDGQVCSICFELWTNSGRHRLVSLKCGHLYGHSCIDKWLKGQGSKCPQCNAPAKRTDFRTIFAKSLKVLDTSERDSALKMLEKEKELRRRAELEVAQIKVKYQMVLQECERVKKELMEQKQWIQAAKATNRIDKRDMLASQSSSIISLVLEKTLDLCKDGGCRVLTSCDILNMLIVSQPSVNNLFPGFGIKKISTMDFRVSEFVSIHQKPIKDIAFHRSDTLVLTASMDRSIKLTNVLSNSIVQSYTLPLEAWSCVWSKDDPNQFFVGLKNGSIFQFDTRMTNSHIFQLPAVGMKSPVIGLQYIQKQLNSGSSLNGLLSGQLSTCCLYEMKRESDYKLHPLPLEGSFTSLSYEPGTGHVLVSCRPSGKHASVTHMLCELAIDESSRDSDVGNICSCSIIQSFSGGDSQVQISKSNLFLHPKNESCILACAGDERAQAALIWDACNGERLQQLKVNDPPVLDVQFFRLDQNYFLGTLTEKTLRLYKWTNI
ncbi:E3 ubiquitin-protein ligase RFWD3-like isoform X2 [Centruroides sculpturatus]|uniref:E3 ubiquitin-protein ligase RFWD3-like isoform X2 n=2 Tax=Centruroides sculpturatus TaxID=218467 RepID=UPI000C6CED35|nr:E3 ubiquitin-protein ligase RFWD3-like isoform X2 [Centruroides sculpturatus]